VPAARLMLELALWVMAPEMVVLASISREAPAAARLTALPSMAPPLAVLRIEDASFRLMAAEPKVQPPDSVSVLAPMSMAAVA